MKKLSALAAFCLFSALQPFCLSAFPASIASGIDRGTISGIDTVLYKTGARDIVTIEAAFPAGDRFNPPGNPAIAMLAAAMLDQGTTTRDKYAIASELEAVGATLAFSSDTNNVTISGKCLAKDAPLLIALIAEQLRTPALDAGEFAKIKTQLTGALQRALENTDARARNAFARAIYPPAHPNHRPTIAELITAIDTASIDDVKTFHAANYGPAQFTLVAAGDIDADAFKAAVAKSFAGWKGGRSLARANFPGTPASPPPAAAPVIVNMPDKTSVSIVIGQATGLKYGDADYHAFATATAILGSGFTGRLLANVRDREGLTYGIGARIANDTHSDGDWRIVATFAPALLDKGIASTRRQLDAWYKDGVTAKELAERKSNLIGSYKVALATTGGMAGAILSTIQRGEPLRALDDYPAKIEALTLEQVNASIKKHLNPARMALIEAGTLPEAKK